VEVQGVYPSALTAGRSLDLVFTFAQVIRLKIRGRDISSTIYIWFLLSFVKVVAELP
jgi:hypothetical protein